MQRITKLSFDANGTLFRVHPSVGHNYAAVAQKYRVNADHQALTKAFLKSWMYWNEKAGNFGLKANMRPKTFWRHIVFDTFDDVINKDELAVHGDKIFEDLYSTFQSAQFWKVYPETHEVLRQLKAEGYPMCVISNFDHRLHAVLTALDLTKYFDFVLTSLEVGHEKPAPEIFREALRRGNWNASSVLHIGDNVRRDFEGAQRVGMQALLIDRSMNDVGLRQIFTVIKDARKE